MISRAAFCEMFTQGSSLTFAHLHVHYIPLFAEIGSTGTIMCKA
jgi:hypothetical protein